MTSPNIKLESCVNSQIFHGCFQLWKRDGKPQKKLFTTSIYGVKNNGVTHKGYFHSAKNNMVNRILTTVIFTFLIIFL